MMTKLFPTCMTVFLLWNMKPKSFGSHIVLFGHTMEVNGNRSCLVTNIPQNIILSHASLE